jgi:UDP-N-acetylmuramoylalanine-D-glutamate ligase
VSNQREGGFTIIRFLGFLIMEAAVNVASTLIDKGVILLSPACASFDMFDDFEQRGDAFKRTIKDII